MRNFDFSVTRFLPKMPRVIPAYLKVWLKRVLFLLGAYALCRLFFLLYNHALFAEDSLGEIAQAFVHGLRFDLSAILFTNAILFLLAFLPSSWRAKKAFVWIDLALFAVINGLALGMNLVDTEFTKFVGKRSSLDLLVIREDIQQQALGMIKLYWYFCVGWLGVLALLVYLVPRYKGGERGPLWALGLWRMATIALVVLGIRGGFQLKPLHPMDAYFTTHHEIALLTLNTPFTLIRSQAHGNIEHSRYFATDREAIERLRALTELSRPALANAKGWNVVEIIIESFGAEYNGVNNSYKGYTPYFDQLTKEPGAIFFKEGFANARRSIDGLPAVICGLPTIMDAPIMTSDLSNNHFECLPHLLHQEGYSTYFLHGAHNGSMHFDTFARIAGFENFVGLNEYPKNNPEDLDDYWGVLDEPMLQYAVQTIDKAKKPVMLSVFTLSSHSPYYIPPKYKDKFPKGTLEIHESIGYADYALGKFFETARTKPWFNNTIFIVTADHTSRTEVKRYETLMGYYRVPILFYIPGLKDRMPATDPERIAEQIDFMPSILDLLGLAKKNQLLVGQSVFDNAREGHALNYDTGGIFWYLDPRVYVVMRPSGITAFTHPKGESDTQTPVPLENEAAATGLLNMKAMIHYLGGGLLKNNLYDWRQALDNQAK
jgi:phosphoglycerol transferase MdoB-like AlkP superfamily enzyme